MARAKWIDGVNYREVTIPNNHGEVTLPGITVRALRAALADMDPDSVVCYMAEQTEETRKVDLLMGTVAGLSEAPDFGVVFMFGPEGVKALKLGGMIE